MNLTLFEDQEEA